MADIIKLERQQAAGFRPRYGRTGLRPLGAGLRPRVRRRVQQGPQARRSPATNKIGGRVLEVGVGTGISLPQYAPASAIFGTDISEAMLEKAKKRVDEQRLEQRRGPRGDGRRKSRIPRQFVRRRDGAICRHRRCRTPRRRSTSSPACCRPGGELIILTPRQRRGRPAPLHRAAAAAGGAPARLPHRRVRLVALRAMAGRCARHRAGRAPPGAAARALLAGPLPQDRRRRGRVTRARRCVTASLHAVTCQHHDVIWRTSNPGNSNPTNLGERHDQEFPAGTANPALGRPSLLSPQPHQPVRCTSSARRASCSPMRCCSSIPSCRRWSAGWCR